MGRTSYIHSVHCTAGLFARVIIPKLYNFIRTASNKQPIILPIVSHIGAVVAFQNLEAAYDTALQLIIGSHNLV